ncbi:major facilitator superfamily domain-containing protein [Thelonectria olida]|uniref:Major facilitator superfamily domain-containing protein n=1 Tax=Thelonectria olida TaxID=1576542 RepID=A0A9P8WCF7_9HYPO|nr:major facilitator superfamily domain-containing protein [Thelonectria olida]
MSSPSKSPSRNIPPAGHNKSVTSLSSSETHTAADSHRLSTGLDEKRRGDQQHRISAIESSATNNAVEPAVEKTAPEGPAYSSEAEENYKPKTLGFWLIVISVLVSMFLVALDRTIISTAIPAITNDFHSLGDIGWYGSAYMLTTAAFQLVFGRIYRFYDLRWTFITTILIFEVGSALCGAAPNSTAFILGRAIAGIGSAGIFTGATLSIIPLVPLHKRPMFQSMFGMVFGVSSICGPLVGGAFTSRVTWRWCFYMNLPIGGVAVVCLYLFQKSPQRPKESVPFMRHITRLDPLGTLFFVPAMVCFILALQWGGSEYRWNNWRIIVLFIVFGLCMIAFGAVQVLMPETATIPVRVIKQRTMFCGFFVMFFMAGAMMVLVYYIPLWFQTTKGVGPIDSGIYTIPLVASMVVSGIAGAGFTQRIGYYVPSMIACPCIMAIGEGLLSTFTPSTGHSHWIGYQFLTGFGLGLGMLTVSLAFQATLPKDDLPTGIAISFFGQQLGGAVFVSVGQTILNAVLSDGLKGIPGLSAKTIVNSGATKLHEIVPAKYMSQVIGAYNHAITRIFIAALALSATQLVFACCVEWKSIKKPEGPPAADNAQAEEEPKSEEK